MSHDPVIRTLARILGQPIRGGQGEYRFNSPFRHGFKNPNKADQNHHLYVNPTRRMYFCHKSSEAGSLSYLFDYLGLAEDGTDVPVPNLDDLTRSVEGLDKRERFQTPSAELPEWCVPVWPGSTVHNYLLGRGITDDDIAHYQIGMGTGSFMGWLVIPSFDRHNRCQYWVSRRAGSGWGPKYRNPEVNRRYHLGFLDLAIKESPEHIVLCEGAISAIAAGRDAVCAFGKYVTNNQLGLLRDSGAKRVTLSLDGDAIQETLDTAERCLRIGLQVSILFLPKDKDPADLGRANYRALLQHQSVAVDSLGLAQLRITLIDQLPKRRRRPHGKGLPFSPIRK